MVCDKILIVFCSRYGSTADISQRIYEEIKRLGMEADLVNLKDSKNKLLSDFSSYQGLMIGTGIKMGQWTKEVKQFIKINLKKLLIYPKPIGFFVTSGLASDPNKYEEIKKLYIEDKFKKFGLQINLYDVFGGVLDLTETSKFSWLDKKIVKELAKKEKWINIEGKNDFRNWSKVLTFTQTFSERVISKTRYVTKI